MNLHVASYVRQSFGRVNGSEASPASQREANRARFDAYSAEVARKGDAARWCDHYEDVGISAYSGKERPGFERLLRDCRIGRVNVIVIYNIARLSRLEPRDALPIVNELMSLGVTIVSVAEGLFQPGDTMDLIHMIFRLDAAHKESSNKSKAVKDAATLARSLGGYVGGKAPYGRKLHQELRKTPDGKPVAVQLLTVDRVQADVLRRVCKTIQEHAGRAAEGTSDSKEVPGSIGAICRELNNAGVPTLGTARGKRTAGSSWHPRTLISILRHPHLAGFDSDPIYAPAGRQVTGHRIRRDASGQPVSTWEPILEPADWFALQEWLDSRPKRKFESRATSLLTSMGIFHCACGATNSANNTARSASYFCNRPQGKPLSKTPGDHEGRAYISRADLDNYIVRSIFGLIEAAEYDDDARATLKRVSAHYAEINETPEVAQERAAVLQERADAQRTIRQLHEDKDLYAGDPISHARWGDDLKAQQARLRSADARLETLGREGTLTLPIGGWLESDNGDPMGPGSWWEAGTLDARREFVRLFVKNITVRKARPDEKSRGSKAKAVIAPRVTITWV